MPNFCRLQVVGHVGGDCDVRYMPSGDQVANFSVAYTEKWKQKDSGEAKERTTWFSVNCWGKLAEIAGEYIRKGNPVLVEGTPYVESWEAKDGEKRFTLKVRADKIVLLGSKRDSEERPAREPDHTWPTRAAPAESKPKNHFSDMESDIPF